MKLWDWGDDVDMTYENLMSEYLEVTSKRVTYKRVTYKKVTSNKVTSKKVTFAYIDLKDHSGNKAKHTKHGYLVHHTIISVYFT